MAKVYMKENMLKDFVSKYGSIKSLKRIVIIDGYTGVFVLPLLNEDPHWYYSDYATLRYNWGENFEDDEIMENEALEILESYGLDKKMLYEELLI